MQAINIDNFFNLNYAEYNSLMQFAYYLNIDKNKLIKLLDEFDYKLEDFNKKILKERWKLYYKTGIKDFGLGKELIPLYIAIRYFKPSRVIETGVGYGSSSIYILKALSENNKNAKLKSIGKPYLFEQNYNLSPGYLITPDLKNYWIYYDKWTWEILEDCLKFGFDIFLHDSDHCAEYMYWELDLVFKYAKKNTIILVHDALNNNAFELIANKYNQEVVYFQCINEPPINAVQGVLGACKIC